LGETDRLPVMTQPAVRHTSSENTVASYFSDSYSDEWFTCCSMFQSVYFLLLLGWVFVPVYVACGVSIQTNTAKQ